jgi:hypothetical protein
MIAVVVVAAAKLRHLAEIETANGLGLMWMMVPAVLSAHLHHC